MDMDNYLLGHYIWPSTSAKVSVVIPRICTSTSVLEQYTRSLEANDVPRRSALSYLYYLPAGHGGAINIDWPLAKNTKFEDCYNLQFRAEFYNIVNYPALNATGANVTFSLLYAFYSDNHAKTRLYKSGIPDRGRRAVCPRRARTASIEDYGSSRHSDERGRQL